MKTFFSFVLVAALARCRLLLCSCSDSRAVGAHRSVHETLWHTSEGEGLVQLLVRGCLGRLRSWGRGQCWAAFQIRRVVCSSRSRRLISFLLQKLEGRASFSLRKSLAQYRGAPRGLALLDDLILDQFGLIGGFEDCRKSIR